MQYKDSLPLSRTNLISLECPFLQNSKNQDCRVQQLYSLCTSPPVHSNNKFPSNSICNLIRTRLILNPARFPKTSLFFSLFLSLLKNVHRSVRFPFSLPPSIFAATILNSFLLIHRNDDQGGILIAPFHRRMQRCNRKNRSVCTWNDYREESATIF